MSIITKLSAQWATRPNEERFTSLPDMKDKAAYLRSRSDMGLISRNQLAVEPDGDDLLFVIDGRVPMRPTHHAYQQLINAYGGHADYIRELPPKLAADCLNHHLRADRGADVHLGGKPEAVSKLGLALSNAVVTTKRQDHSIYYYQPESEDDREPAPYQLRALCGPDYGRIYNETVIDILMDRFGDGVTGDWRVPGEFGTEVAKVTKANTSLYMGEEDLFIGLTDERNKVELPGRRSGQAGAMSRALLVWNSEVGSRTFGIALFYFDFACCNRIFWGVENYVEVTLKHSKNAVRRFKDEAMPALKEFLGRDTDSQFLTSVEAARRLTLSKSKADDLIAGIAGKRKVPVVRAQHLHEEGREIETVWDVTTGLTAWSRNLPFSDERYKIDKAAGKLLEVATA